MITVYRSVNHMLALCSWVLSSLISSAIKAFVHSLNLLLAPREEIHLIVSHSDIVILIQ